MAKKGTRLTRARLSTWPLTGNKYYSSGGRGGSTTGLERRLYIVPSGSLSLSSGSTMSSLYGVGQYQSELLVVGHSSR